MKSLLKLTSLLYVVLLLVFPASAFAASSYTVTGTAKVLNTGEYLDFGGQNSNVQIDSETGNFSGYAFSNDIGWIAFGTTDNDQGPVNVNLSSGRVTGKAKALNTGAYLDFTNYNSNVTFNGYVFSGFGFSEDLGWLDFSDVGVRGSGNFMLKPPVVYFKFDEGQGTTAHNSGALEQAISGTITNATWQTEDLCIFGKCLYFNGSSAVVTVSTAVNQVKSVSFWVKPKTNGESMIDLDGGSHKITASSGTITATGFTTLYVDGKVSSTLTANTWQHIEATTATAFNTTTVTIGNSGSSYLNGFMDEVKMYDYQRSAAQIKADFNSRGAIKGVSARIGGQDTEYLSEGLVGYWKMDESSGNAADSSGNSLTLTNNGTTTYAAGKFGNASSYNGTTQYLNTATAINGVKTVSFWAYTPDTTNYFINLINSSAYITSSSGTFTATGFTSPSIYVNGVLNGTISANTWTFITITTNTGINANAFAVGLTNDGSNHYYTNTSKVDEVRLYNRALSPKEISDLYNWAPGPVGYWNFEEGSGTTANDTSGNGYNGTITGATYQSGKFGKALNFNGSTDAVGSISSISGIQTVSFWVNPSSTTANLIDVQTSPGTINISASSGTISATGFTSPTYYVNGVQTTSPTLTANTWQYITVTSATAVTGSALRFGRISITSLTGKLDEIKVYNYARTAKQIVSDMNAGHPAVGSPLGSAVGYWKFDEGYGTTANNSGNGGSALNGNLSGSTVPSWTNSGKFGKALSFNGTSAYIAMPSDASALKITSDITLSAWINLTNTSSTHDIICKYTGTASTSAYCLYTDTNGKLNMSVVNSTGPAIVTTTGTKTLSSSTWYHVVGVLNTTLGSVDLYVNGVLDKHNTTSIPTTLQNPTTILDIGAENAGSDLFAGTIDEPKVYNFALTADEVKTEYNRGSSLVLGALSDNSSYQKGAANQEYCVPGDTTACAAPIGRWDFEEGSGGTAYDTSGNGHSGTSSNTSVVPGIIGKGRYFNPALSQTWVDFGASSQFQSSTGTLSIWFKSLGILSSSGSSSGRQSIITNYNGGDFETGDFMLEICESGSGCGGSYGGKLFIEDYISSSQDVVSASSVADGKWHFVAVVFNGTSRLTYLDGILIHTRNENNTILNSAIDLKIGEITQPSYPSRNFNGYLDQFRIYNYARSGAQVAWDYNRGAPVGHWKFDECQGTVANDSSGNSRTGTITIGASGEDTVGTCSTSSTAWGSGATGKRNYSLSLDGTDDKVTSAAFSPLATAAQTTTKFSWGGWFYPTTSAASKTLLEKATEFQLTTDSNSMPLCGIYYSGAFNNSAAPTQGLTLSAWNHVICAYDGTNINTYLNGRLIKQSANTNSVTAASSILYMGQTSGGANFYSGQIDDVKIFNYALTAAQVKDSYNGGAIFFGPLTGSP